MMRRSEHRGAEVPRPEGNVQRHCADAIGETITVTGTISRKEKMLGRRYSTVSTLLEVNCGTCIVTLFSTARWAHAAQVGEQVTVTGTVKKHQRWRGGPQTLLGWTTRVDNPAPTASNEALRVGDGWPAGEVTIRRRFPDNPNPATPPQATSATAATVDRQP